MMDMKDSAKVGFGLALGVALVRMATFGLAIAAGIILTKKNE